MYYSSGNYEAFAGILAPDAVHAQYRDKDVQEEAPKTEAQLILEEAEGK